METGDTHRLQLILHYDGSLFHGWQYQPDHRTVQGDLQTALRRLTGEPRTVVGSGRTDTGVHATGQVAIVDLPVRWTPEELERALNAVLPRDIWVESVRSTRRDFHPRHQAVARSYEYRVGTEPQACSPFARRSCWALAEPLDRDRLDRAAALLPGDHSFRAFAKSGQPHRGYRAIVESAGWSEWELGLRFRITANRYLHHMVRYLVGTMVAIGRHQRPLEDMAALMAGAPDMTTSPPAPPEGLFLTEVEYPDLTETDRRSSTTTERSKAPAS
ncbi:MAG: tRNA pseudouridine(38-40) synthase TruA [Longimicrobiales bacterium]